MSDQALIFAEVGVDEKELAERLKKQFDNFEVVIVTYSEYTIFYNTNRMARTAREHNGPVFLIVTKPLFSAVAAAKLSRALPSFLIMEWEGERFRVLKVP